MMLEPINSFNLIQKRVHFSLHILFRKVKNLFAFSHILFIFFNSAISLGFHIFFCKFKTIKSSNLYHFLHSFSDSRFSLTISTKKT